MYRFIKGDIRDINFEEGMAIIENAGIGYEIRMTGTDLILLSKKTGRPCKLNLYHHIAEDLSDLYGFLDAADLDLFKLLITVNGIGVKTAMTMLSKNDSENIKAAICNKDVKCLSKLPGIGAKTAQRIIMELENKVTGIDVKDGECLSRENLVMSDVVSSLEYLGVAEKIPAKEIREFIKENPNMEAYEIVLHFNKRV